MNMPRGDEFLREFITYNFDCILLAFYFLQGLWPQSRILAAVKEGFSQAIQKARRKEQ